MKNRILTLFLLGGTIAGITVSLSSCGDSIESLIGSKQVVSDASGRVEFSQVLPIVSQKCSRCHSNVVDSTVLHSITACAASAVFASGLFAKGGYVRFYSSTPLEDIEGVSQTAVSTLDLDSGKKIPVEVDGDLDVHGVKKRYIATGFLQKGADGSVSGETRFLVRIADHGIKVPAIVTAKIADSMQITARFTWRPGGNAK